MLAPVDQPDPCAPVALPGGNLAYGKPARASAWLPSEPPAFAVDESAGTQWGSGADEPQWIEIDLQGVHRLTGIRLLVAQYPEGLTRHRLSVRRGAGWEQVHEFAGETRAGNWLAFTPTIPLDGVSGVRVDTVLSPSWVAWSETEVFGEAAP